MDLPDEDTFKRMVKAFVDDTLPKAMEDVEKLLNKNRIFIDRTKGVGPISRAEAVAWSLTGPMARASGVRRDIRKDEPYLCFKDNWDGQGAKAVDFKVPVMTTGDVYARYLVRLEEMKQSMGIIRQLIDRIPAGPVNVSPEGKDVLPPKDQVYSSIEGLIQHFELIMTNRGFEAPRGEVYYCIESGNGEILGYYIVSAGENLSLQRRSCTLTCLAISITRHSPSRSKGTWSAMWWPSLVVSTSLRRSWIGSLKFRSSLNQGTDSPGVFTRAAKWGSR